MAIEVHVDAGAQRVESTIDGIEPCVHPRLERIETAGKRINTTPEGVDPAIESGAKSIDPARERVAKSIDPARERVTLGIDTALERVTEGVDPTLERVTEGVDPTLERLTLSIDAVPQCVDARTQIEQGAQREGPKKGDRTPRRSHHGGTVALRSGGDRDGAHTLGEVLESRRQLIPVP